VVLHYCGQLTEKQVPNRTLVTKEPDYSGRVTGSTETS